MPTVHVFISASLARANERVHVHNERNFPQAKLDSEINVPFLLNESKSKVKSQMFVYSGHALSYT